MCVMLLQEDANEALDQLLDDFRSIGGKVLRRAMYRLDKSYTAKTRMS